MQKMNFASYSSMHGGFYNMLQTTGKQCPTMRQAAIVQMKIREFAEINIVWPEHAF